ncbi:TPA: LysR family transcriptional regulator [Providencia alcalifaciens]|nr:LysR family transcriptional regulator [Providencia alcalifaciens]
MFKSYSPEALWAFIEIVSQRSFTLAARKLGKSQSTISTAISNLEIDLGLTLFDRQFRKPTLTEAGRKVYNHALDIISANENLHALTCRLAENIEHCLTIVFSDHYITPQAHLMSEFSKAFPDVELECIVAENIDAVKLLQDKRAHLGIILSMDTYPVDITVSKLALTSHLSLYVAHSHPLASVKNLSYKDLMPYRQLYLNHIHGDQKPFHSKIWSAPQYLMLMEMAIQQFGWVELPHVLVDLYAQNQLTRLSLPGYPKTVPLDLIWSRNTELGPAANWVINQFRQG